MMYIMQKKIHSHVNGGKIKHAYGWYVLILIPEKVKDMVDFFYIARVIIDSSISTHKFS